MSFRLQASDEPNFHGTSDSSDESDDGEPVIKLRRSQYTLNVLQSWYSQKYSGSDSTKPKICVIIPNFEEFKATVIVDLILILR